MSHGDGSFSSSCHSHTGLWWANQNWISRIKSVENFFSETVNSLYFFSLSRYEVVMRGSLSFLSQIFSTRSCLSQVEHCFRKVKCIQNRHKSHVCYGIRHGIGVKVMVRKPTFKESHCKLLLGTLLLSHLSAYFCQSYHDFVRDSYS